MKLKLPSNKTKNKINIDLIILTLMYAAGSLGVVSREILNFNIILFIKYSIIILGTLYFLNNYIRKYSRGNGEILLPFKTKSWSLLFFWVMFSFSVIISQSYNGQLPFEGIAYLVFNIVVFFLVIPMTLDNPEETIIKASFFASFSYLIISAFYEPVIFGSYYFGITYNPNSIGQLAVQAAISIFCLFLNSLENISKEKKKSLISFLLFIVSVAFILLSSSRTSFFALLLPSVFVIFIFVWARKIRLRYLIMPASLFTIIYFVSLREYLQIGILNKFNRYNSDDLLSGRDIIWNKILEDISLFGHGPNYFTEVIGKGAHNSILEVIGSFGVIAGLIITLFYIDTIIISIKYAIKNRKKQYFYVPMIVILTFTILSMTESMFGVIGKSMTLVTLNIVGLLIFRNLLKVNDSFK